MVDLGDTELLAPEEGYYGTSNEHAHGGRYSRDSPRQANHPSVGRQLRSLNYHPKLHGLLADGDWKDGVFTRSSELDLKAIEQAYAARVLAQLHNRDLLTDVDVAQIPFQHHTDFGVWMNNPFHDKESEQLVARYIERALLVRLIRTAPDEF